MKTRVVRVGGSLLTWNKFPSTFKRWQMSLPSAGNILIAGGGPWVELLRQATRRFEISEAKSHLLCLQAMSVTAALLAEICDCPVVNDIDELRQADQGNIAFDACRYFQLIDPHCSDPLPQSWKATSDSIAARIARELGADELILLKSIDCPMKGPLDFGQLSSAGYVDPYFSTAAKGLTVSCINLRNL